MELTKPDLNQRMRDALRLYEGDTRVRGSDGRLCSRQSSDPFYGDQKAYKTLNALLYPGVSNECTRICREKGKLNPIFVRNLEKSIEVYCDIFRLMCRQHREGGEVITAKRVERKDSLELLKKGQTVSFFSGSKAGYSQSFAEKDGIVLLEIHVSPQVPYVDFEEALGEEYKRIEEREVLLPPFVNISMEEAAMDRSSGKSVRDMDGRRPVGRYRLKTIDFSDSDPKSLVKESPDSIKNNLLEGREMAGETVEAMNRGEWERDFSAYISWKKHLREYLRYQFFLMWSSVAENKFQNPM